MREKKTPATETGAAPTKLTSGEAASALSGARLRALIAAGGDVRAFAVYASDPAGFCQDVLGVALWAKQLDVLEATLDNRRVAVRSGHGVGKTFAVACLVLWWLYARQGLVVTTAPTKENVEDVLWRQIHELLANARVPLPGERFNSELKIDHTWYAVGITTEKSEAFQGRHHARLLVVIDEAPGVDERIHHAIASLATGSENRIVMIGNPYVTSGTFYEAFKHPDRWRTFRISCFDHPNVTGKGTAITANGAVDAQWIEERRAELGEHHPFWFAQVLGEFPKVSTRGVIPLGWVERAQNETRRLQALKEAEAARLPRIGGLDVARYGDNRCVLFVRCGDAVEAVESWHHASLMETAGIALSAMKRYGIQSLVIDSAGIGAGVYDRMMEQNSNVFAYNGGHAAFTRSTFSNRRSEMWWHLRQRLDKERLWLPERGMEQLVGDLVSPEYELTSTGRIKVETKEKLLDRGVKSPDFADALVLCFALDLNPEEELAVRPGFGQDPLSILDIMGSQTEGINAGTSQDLGAGF
jgi:hypothetical protein